MANFSITNSTAVGAGNVQQNLTTTFKTIIVIGNSTATTATNGWAGNRRYKITDIIIGTNGTPADNYMQWDISRFSATAILTANAVTPSPLDQADAACAAASYANATTENTYITGLSVFNVGVNQRASYRWVAAPGSEIIWPATSSAGIVLRVKSPGYTGTATGQLYITEM